MYLHTNPNVKVHAIIQHVQAMAFQLIASQGQRRRQHNVTRFGTGKTTLDDDEQAITRIGTSADIKWTPNMNG